MNYMKKLANKKNINIPIIPIDRCIGKTIDGVPGMTTYEHCLIVGYVAQVFRRILPSYLRKKLPRKICSLAALHDVGKISPGFILKIYRHMMPELIKLCPDLAKLPESMFDTNHTIISEASLLARYSKKDTCAIYSSIIGAHHGYGNLNPDKDACIRYGGPAWAKLRREFCDKITKEFGEPYLTDLKKYDSEIISGFISLCDWIASDTRFFSASGNIKDIHREAFKVIKSLGWTKTVVKHGLTFKDLFNFDPRSEQKAFIDSVTKPGVYILESRTGSGKTEPAFAAAYKLIAAGYHSGIYVALPTRVTSQRLYKRFKSFLENAFEKGMSPHLIHGQSDIAEVDIGSEELSPGSMWFKANRRALMLPFGIGTVDQILLSAIHAKYNFIRTFGIANKVVIIDELHSYDAYTGKITDLLIKKLRELDCTVIVLSATLTKERKRQLLGNYKSEDIRYPLITYKIDDKIYTKSAGKGSSRKIHVRKVSDNFPKLYKEAEKRILAGQQVLWILNTVDRATAVYKEMIQRPALSGLISRIGLIHSRFPAKDRNALEDLWMERLGNGKNSDRSQGSLLISTQVLEQSVDVDSDFLITDLAPTDFIVQRAGRLFRHEGRTNRSCNKAEMWIVCPSLSRITDLKDLRNRLGVHAKIYSEYVLWRSYRTWKRISTLNDPEDLRDILENTYRDSISQDPVWVKEAYDNMYAKKLAMRDLAVSSTGSNVRLFDSDESDEEDFNNIDTLQDEDNNTQTRLLSVPTKQLILLKTITDKKDTFDISFVDGESISCIKDKRSFISSKAMTYRMVKVPINKKLGLAQSPIYFKPFVFGSPIPVTVDTLNIVRLLDGTDTGYLYEKTCGFYKSIIL